MGRARALSSATAVAAVMLLAACNQDSGNRAPAAGRSAAELVEQLGCEPTGEEHVDPEVAVKPIEAVACRVGERHMRVEVYGSAREVDAVLDELSRFTGYRAVGDDWIVAVNSEEAAEFAANRLRGKVVELVGRASILDAESLLTIDIERNDGRVDHVEVLAESLPQPDGRPVICVSLPPGEGVGCGGERALVPSVITASADPDDVLVVLLGPVGAATIEVVTDTGPVTATAHPLPDQLDVSGTIAALDLTGATGITELVARGPAGDVVARQSSRQALAAVESMLPPA